MFYVFLNFSSQLYGISKLNSSQHQCRYWLPYKYFNIYPDKFVHWWFFILIHAFSKVNSFPTLLSHLDIVYALFFTCISDYLLHLCCTTFNRRSHCTILLGAFMLNRDIKFKAWILNCIIYYLNCLCCFCNCNQLHLLKTLIAVACVWQPCYMCNGWTLTLPYQFWCILLHLHLLLFLLGFSSKYYYLFFAAI